MAFHMLVSPPLSVTKILSLEIKFSSPSLAIWNSNVPRQTQCKASYKGANDIQKVARRSAKFQPSIWTDDYIQSLSSEYKEEIYVEEGKVLREEVRMMLCKLENEIDQLEFIDVLQRLGVDYHFKDEIRNILDNIYNTQTFNLKKSLYTKALEFRLLRQHGYNISADCFQDEMGKLTKSQYVDVDVEGMLSLYEASFHLFEDETILEEARDITSNCLKDHLNQNRDNYHTSLLITHALELPLHWRVARWEAQWFINAYETKQNMNHVLLQFAKLDFNIVQSIYQKELKHASRWWKSTRVGEKLSFTRNRLVENFIWTVGVNFNPEFEYFRKIQTKVVTFITIIDDLYDAYGTLEELELFTEAIDKWELNAMESLPDYMKICFHALFNFVNQIAFETMKMRGYNIIPYLKKAWADLCKAYLIEAKWYHSAYTPSLAEYTENAWISISTHVVFTYAYFLIDPHTFKMEEWSNLEENSDIIRYSAMIFRLANDLGTYERENGMGDTPKTIQCYMKETGVSEVEAREYVKSVMYTVWMKLNKEVETSTFSPAFKDIALNLARIALCMYQHGDGHTIQDPKTQSHISSLIFQPITIANNTFYAAKN